MAEEERLGIGQNAANRTNIQQINPDFFEQAVNTAGLQMLALGGGAVRGLSETFDPTQPGESPNYLSQLGANTAADAQNRVSTFLEDDQTGMGDRYRGGVTTVDPEGSIFNPFSYSRPIDPETGEKISFEDSFKNPLDNLTVLFAVILKSTLLCWLTL